MRRKRTASITTVAFPTIERLVALVALACMHACMHACPWWVEIGWNMTVLVLDSEYGEIGWTGGGGGEAGCWLSVPLRVSRVYSSNYKHSEVLKRHSGSKRVEVSKKRRSSLRVLR